MQFWQHRGSEPLTSALFKCQLYFPQFRIEHVSVFSMICHYNLVSHIQHFMSIPRRRIWGWVSPFWCSTLSEKTLIARQECLPLTFSFYLWRSSKIVIVYRKHSYFYKALHTWMMATFTFLCSEFWCSLSKKDLLKLVGNGTNSIDKWRKINT